MKICKASEDYLETILMMQEKKGYICSIDVAEQLEVTNPSVCYSTKRLRGAGYITMDEDRYITLTDTGAGRFHKRSDKSATSRSFVPYSVKTTTLNRTPFDRRCKEYFRRESDCCEF